jgi:hypothetical protein
MNSSLSKKETKLVGSWIVKNGRVEGDKNTERIERLVSNVLKYMAASEDGWENLYIDFADNRLWELTFPKLWMHGGGPPQLRHISEIEAKQKYKY